MNRALSFLSGVVMGGLVGATLAILLAPASGEELRSQMQNQARNIELEVKQAAASRRSELEHQLEALRTPKQSSQM